MIIPDGPAGPSRGFIAMGGMAGVKGGGRRRTAGSGLIAAVIALAVSATAVSAGVVLLNTSRSRDNSLRVRVDLNLEADRAIRSIASLLKDAAPAEPPTPRAFRFRRGPDSLEIAQEDEDLLLRRFDPSHQWIVERVLARHVESVDFAPLGECRLQITVKLRRTVDQESCSVRRSVTSELRAVKKETGRASAPACALE